MTDRNFKQVGVPQLQATGQNLVAGAITGAVDDAVLNFNAVAAVGAPGIAIASTGNNGTIVTVTRAGVYVASYAINVGTAVAVDSGISLNSSAAMLVGNPLMTDASMLYVNNCLPAAATVHGLSGSIAIVVTRALAAAAGGALIRFHGTNGAGMTIADAQVIDNAQCNCRVVKVAECYT